MTCFALANGLNAPRLGIAASAKMGNAVARNRAKRRVRELFRAHMPTKPIDVVFVPRREIVHAAWPDLEARLKRVQGKREEAAAKIEVPIVLFSYLNPLLRRGLEQLAQEILAADPLAAKLARK